MNRKIFAYSVVTSIVASIIFSWCVAPLTQWLWHVSTSNALSWFTTQQNNIFENAALGKRDWVVTLMFFFAISAYFGLGMGAILSMSFGSLFEKWFANQKFKKVQIVVVVVLFVYLGFDLAKTGFGAYADLQLNASFSQRLDALGPYMETIDERDLKSQWAMMKTRQDYERINKRLDELATKAKISLPKALYQ